MGVLVSTGVLDGVLMSVEVAYKVVLATVMADALLPSVVGVKGLEGPSTFVE
jgi:hypothetical protein